MGKGEQLRRSGTWWRCSHNLKAINTHTSQRYLQTAQEACCSSWCFEQIFEDRECFLLQMKCMMSLSVKVTFFWALLIISVWEIEPKTKETTVNYFALRHYWSIEEWEQWVSKTIRQNRMGFSYIFSWCCQVWLPAQPIFPSVSLISAVTAYNVGVFKKTWGTTWISFFHHRSQFQTSIKFSL